MADGYGSLALAASQYGGYGALDGYEKTIDCNSALGLLGLLGLIELLRDVVENVVEEEDEEERRKRSTNSGGPSNFLVGFFRDGGAGRLLHTLPLTLLPLLHNFVDVNDGLESPACLERSICEANHALVSESSSSDDALGSTVGSLVSSLMSQVVAKSFTSDGKTYLKAMKAAEVGRRRAAAACREVFHECSELKLQHSPSPGANITDILHTRLAHAT